MAGNKLTRHHLVPASKGGTWNKDNIKRLKAKYHEAFHTIFYNDTPSEQIQRILNINITALTEDFVTDVQKILEIQEHDYFYKNGILLPKRGDF